MFPFIYVVTIGVCAVIGQYNWGSRGMFIGAGIGFMLAPLVGYIFQFTRNRGQVRAWSMEYIKRRPGMVEAAFPGGGELKRLRLLEHTMLSISSILNKTVGTGAGESMSGPKAREAVAAYAHDCALDDKSEALEELVNDLYEWMLEKMEERSA